MFFSACAVLGSSFLLFSFILEIFLIIGQVSNTWFLTRIFFQATWNPSQNLSYSFGLWNYCTGDASRNIQSCSHPQGAYNWAQTPNIVDLVPDLANSKMVQGIFYALFILIFISMGVNFILWVMTIPVLCSKRRRSSGWCMSAFCLINFLITLVCVILALVLIISSVKQITGANEGWRAHAGNALWILIGVCVSNLIALTCYSGSICGSAPSRNQEYDLDNDVNDSESRHVGLFCCCERRGKNPRVDPVNKEYTSSDSNNHNSTFSNNAQPVYSSYAAQNPQNTAMLQQPYVLSNGANNTAAAGFHTMPPYPSTPGSVPTQNYQTPILQQSDLREYN